MYWNYRIIRHSKDGDEHAWFGLHEVYYEQIGAMLHVSYVGEPEVIGESVEDIKQTLQMMLDDIDKHPTILEESVLFEKNFILSKEQAG